MDLLLSERLFRNRRFSQNGRANAGYYFLISAFPLGCYELDLFHTPGSDCRIHVAGYPKNLRFWIGEVHKRGGKEHYYQYMNSRMPKIEDWIHRILPMMETATELPRTHIHTDAHPGNFKFDNDKVVGVFDFDWVQVDFRIYEVAFVLTTFGSDWYWDTNGVHFMNRMKIVLDAYNDEVSKIDGMAVQAILSICWPMVLIGMIASLEIGELSNPIIL